MIHIRLFEKFDKSEYYQEITKDEYPDVPEKRRPDGNSFTRYESEFLGDLFNIPVSGNWVQKHWYHDIDGKEWTMDEIRDYYYRTGKKKVAPRSCFVRIDKLNDEWFYVILDPKRNPFKDIGSGNLEFYKCDQFEGLVELLRDKNIIK